MTSSRIKTLAALLLVAVAAPVGWALWQQQQTRLPANIAYGNGRIEAKEIQIATKYAGRIAEVAADEGDWVRAGEVVAHMDTSELEASRERARAEVAQAQETRAEVEALVVQREAELKYAEAELRRAETLLKQGHIPRDTYEKRQSERDVARATLNAARARIATTDRSIDAAQAEVRRISTQIEDSALTAPRDGRVQYRLANPGEVLPAGGRVLTLLDLTDVSMSIFLPTQEAGRARIGAEARIVFDAAPEYVVPARVTFVAGEAQFTPKEVETRSERDKLMFRVKVTIDPELLKAHLEKVKTGLPGVAYVQLGAGSEWPPRLTPKLPPADVR